MGDPVTIGQRPGTAARFRPDIQGLRAVAVLLVVAGHGLGYPSGGYVGVDVFFVISGFLITGLLLREHERSGRISLRRFYARRVRRLLPAAVLVLAVTNVASWLLFAGERAGQSLRDAAWALGFLANVHFSALGTDYFDETRPASPVQHYWSLAVEEQFYLVWPAVLLVLLAVAARWTPSSRRLLPVGVAALTAASLVWSVLVTRSDPTAAYFSTPARAWELGVGALLALAVAHRPLTFWRRLLPGRSRLLPGLHRAGPVLTWAGLGVIAVAALRFDGGTAFPGTAAVVPVLGAALVLLGGALPGAPGGNPLLENPVSDYLGRLSYSLYLWHWPVLVLAAALLPGSRAGTAAALALSVALAALCHHLVEEPVRRSGWLGPRPAAPAAARATRARSGAGRSPTRTAVAVSSVVALLLGGWVLPALALHTASPAPDAAPARVGESPAQLVQAVAASVSPAGWPALDVALSRISTAGSPEWVVDRCNNVDQANRDRCTYGPAGATKHAVVLGDSIATSWVPALRARLEPRGWRLHLLTRNQCPNPLLPLFRTDPSTRFVECDQHKAWALDQVRRLRPQLVLMSNSTTFVDHQVGEPQGTERYRRWTDGLVAAIRPVDAAAGRVVVLAPPPRSGNLQECVTRISRPSACTEPLGAPWSDLRAAERAAAARSGVDYLDPESWFCARGSCPAVVGSTPVHSDGRHLTAAYARRLAPSLGAELDRLAAERRRS